MAQPVDAFGDSSEVFAVLARSIPARLVEISRSGCLLESRYPIDDGTVGELRLEVRGLPLVDDVRVTRCIRVEGSGSSYLVGAEFVQTRRPGDQSIRRAVTGILRALTTEQVPGPSRSSKSGNRKNQATPEPLAPAPVVNAVSTGDVVMKHLLARLVHEEEGQDIIEYGLLAGLITTGVVVVVGTVADRVLELFEDLDTAIAEVP